MRLRLLLSAGIVPVAVASGVACGGSVVPGLSGSEASSSSSGRGGAGTVSTGTGGSASTGSGGSTSTGSGGSGGALASPPPPGPPNAPDGTGTVVFAVSKLYLGDTDPDGTPDPKNGWARYGYNLDGLPPGSPKRCKPPGGTSTMLQEEGPGGVQNSFGHNLLPGILGLSSSAETDTNAACTADAGAGGG